MKPIPWLLAAIAASGCLGGGSAPTNAAEIPTPAVNDILPEIRAILDAVAGDEPVVVSARMVGRVSGFEAPADVTIRLRPSEVLNESTWFMVEDQVVDAPRFGLLEGEIEGRPDTEARLAWTPEWARGVILADETLQFVFIGRSPHRAPPIIYNLPTTTTGLALGLPFDLEEESPNAEDCQRLQPDLSAPTPSDGRFEGALYMMRTIMDGDALFAAAHGDDAFPLLAAYLNDVDAIFENEFGLRLRLAGAHLHLDERRIPPEENPLGPLAGYWNNRTHLARDLVHLFTGRPQYGAQANCIGGAGNPEVAYTFVPAIYGDRDANSALVTTAHEMGHILGGHHHYGNLVEAEGATIMLHSYLPGNRPIFGTLERSVIRAWVVNHFAPWDGSGSE